MMDRTVAVIGGGVAGLTAALELARFGFQVDVIEKADFAGGHAIRFACKATDQCVKCGACIVEEKLAQVIEDPGIRLLSGQSYRKNFKIPALCPGIYQSGSGRAGDVALLPGPNP